MKRVRIVTSSSKQFAQNRTVTTRKPAWQAVFTTKEEYDKSVASVVARIKSGEVQPRVPDEDEE